MKKIIKIFPIVFLTLAVIPLSVQAFSFDELFNELEELFSDEEWFSDESSDSQIINKINVSATTGQTTINGEIKEGETKTNIQVKNIINGTEIDSIEIESEANEVKVESKIEVDDGIAQVQREIEIDSEKSVENYEVDLEKSACGTSGTPCESATEGGEEIENEGELKENLDAVQEWWSDFVEDLQSFFQSIFDIF